MLSYWHACCFYKSYVYQKSCVPFVIWLISYENLMAAGVIDPTKVVRLALQNAASVAGLVITTEAAISEKPGKKSKAPAMPDMDEDMH